MKSPRLRKSFAHRSATGNTPNLILSRQPISLGLICSPRGNIAYSFLIALEWLRNLPLIFGLRSHQTPAKVQASAPALWKGKYKHDHSVKLLLSVLFLLGAAALQVAHNAVHNAVHNKDQAVVCHPASDPQLVTDPGGLDEDGADSYLARLTVPSWRREKSDLVTFLKTLWQVGRVSDS